LLLEEVEADKSWYQRGGTGTLWTDQRNFYTRSDYRFAAMSLGLAATFAHTDVDEDFRNWWQEDVRSNAWDDFSHFTKPFGDGYISVAIMGTGAVFGSLAKETWIGELSGEWGRRSLRSIAVGAPALLFLQAATGAGRPGEWSSESDWVPFKDTNGASGHAFMGAVPFLVAAQMTDNRLLSGLWYTGSLMCGVSRINDDAHYLSQVILGWSLAQLACEAVDLTESERGDIEVVPMVGQGGTVGIGVQFRR
jgi:membrane-associated phospholipid phosphatase